MKSRKLLLFIFASVFPMLLSAQITFFPGFSKHKKVKLKITHLTGDFYVYSTFKSNFQTNGLYLVTDSGVVMIDTPWDTLQFQPLLDKIKTNHNKEVVICIATHSHDDRTSGLEYYSKKGINTYATVLTDSISKMRNEKRASFLILNDTTFSFGQYVFETYYPGPGHTSDNIVIWFPKDRILYGGCLVKSNDAKDLGNLEDANRAAWPSTIKNLKTKYGRPSYIIPGHYRYSKGKSALNHTLQLLRQQQHADTIYDNRLCLKIAPLALIDPYCGPSLRVGVEFKLKKNFGLYQEIGTFIPAHFNGYFWNDNTNGVTSKTELKYYTNRKKLTAGNYFSAEFFYKYQAYDTGDSILVEPAPVYYKNYSVTKNVYCLTFKYGELITYKNGLIVDLFCGFGIRYKLSTSTLSDTENENLVGEGDNSTNLLVNQAGHFIYPNFDVGIKIGYRIK